MEIQYPLNNKVMVIAKEEIVNGILIEIGIILTGKFMWMVEDDELQRTFKQNSQENNKWFFFIMHPCYSKQ